MQTHPNIHTKIWSQYYVEQLNPNLAASVYNWPYASNKCGTNSGSSNKQTINPIEQCTTTQIFIHGFLFKSGSYVYETSINKGGIVSILPLPGHLHSTGSLFNSILLKTIVYKVKVFPEFLCCCMSLNDLSVVSSSFNNHLFEFGRIKFLICK